MSFGYCPLQGVGDNPNSGMRSLLDSQSSVAQETILKSYQSCCTYNLGAYFYSSSWATVTNCLALAGLTVVSDRRS